MFLEPLRRSFADTFYRELGDWTIPALPVAERLHADAQDQDGIPVAGHARGQSQGLQFRSVHVDYSFLLRGGNQVH